MTDSTPSDRMSPTLVVLAAGIGSRYGGLKQIDPVGPHGEIILDYSLYDALRAGFGKVVFVIREEIEAPFRDRVGRSIEERCETVYVLQRKDLPAGFEVPADRQKPWGTAHATLMCKDAVDTPFAVINADDFYGCSTFEALGDYLRRAQDRDGLYDYCLVGYLLANTLSEHGHVARGICVVGQDGTLLEIRERTHIQRFGQTIKYAEDDETWVEIAGSTPVSLNMWGFTPSLFAELDARFLKFVRESRDNILKAEFFLPDVVGDLVQEGRAMVRVLPTNEGWFGITYPQDKPRVQQAIQGLIRQGIYPDRLWEEAP
jgi:NDP-sugar pyrophosphorylase family protein